MGACRIERQSLDHFFDPSQMIPAASSLEIVV
jgi:hypothetical protein